MPTPKPKTTPVQKPEAAAPAAMIAGAAKPATTSCVEQSKPALASQPDISHNEAAEAIKAVAHEVSRSCREAS